MASRRGRFKGERQNHFLVRALALEVVVRAGRVSREECLKLCIKLSTFIKPYSDRRTALDAFRRACDKGEFTL